MKALTLFFGFWGLLSVSTAIAQFNYADEAEEMLSVHSVKESRVDVMMVMDCSGSMTGEPIQNLNTALGTFYNEMRGNEKVSLGVITFDTDARMIRTPNTVSDYERAPRLSTQGYTNMTLAFELAEYELKKRPETAYKPIVIVMTDGMPDNSYTALQAAASLRNYAQVYVVGVNAADLSFLTKIAGNVELADMVRSTDAYGLFFKEVALSLNNHVSDNSEVLLSTSGEPVPFKVSNKTGWKK